MIETKIFLTIIFLTLFGLSVIMLTKRYSLCLVVGTSMYPMFNDGEIVIVDKKVVLSEMKEGKCFAFHSPQDIVCVKQFQYMSVDPTNGDIGLFFIGVNRNASIDSRHYGCIKPEDVIGKVIKIWKWGK